MNLNDNNIFKEYDDTYKKLVEVNCKLHTLKLEKYKKNTQNDLLTSLSNDNEIALLLSEEIGLKREIDEYEKFFGTIGINFFLDYTKLEVVSILESIDKEKLVTKEFDRYRKKIRITDTAVFTSRVMQINKSEADKISFLSTIFGRLINYIHHDYDIPGFDDRFLDIYNMLIKIQSKIFSLDIPEHNKISIDGLYTICSLQRTGNLLSYMKRYKDGFIPMQSLDIYALSPDIKNQFGTKASELQNAINDAQQENQKIQCKNDLMDTYERLYRDLGLIITKESINYFSSYLLDFIRFCKDPQYVQELLFSLKQKYNTLY